MTSFSSLHGRPTCRWTAIVTVSMIAIALAGCSSLVPALTPADAVRQQLLADARASDAWGDISTLRILGQRQWQGGVVVLFTTQVPASAQHPAFEEFGYRLVEPSPIPGGWIATGGGGGGGGVSSPQELVSYGIGGNWDSEGFGTTIVYGRILAPQVRAVEATFGNGQIVRDDLGGGVFALMVSLKTDVCELRVLGENDALLRSIEPGALLSAPRAPGSAEDRCP